MISHSIILASAGSGKTYRLANRILGLLLDGAAPESIVALTFTRKAASEFISRVLTSLAAAAADDAAARELGAALGRRDVTRELCVRRLRETVESSHRLRFGTMDGFFQSLLRTHPLEFGLPSSFTLLDARGAAMTRGRILRKLLRSRADDDTEAFLAAFRLASHGRESRGLARDLESFATDSYELFRASPGEAAWGGEEAVWGGAKCRWLPAGTVDELEKSVLRAREELEGFTCAHAGFAKLIPAFLDSAGNWMPGQPVSRLKGLWKQMMTPAFIGAAERGEEFRCRYSRKEIVVGASQVRALFAVQRAILGLELDSCLRLAQGAGGLLARYDRLYKEAAIDAGRLTFSDIVHLLGRENCAEALAQLAYRLDSRAKHWLFDEFQDTSRRTWRILEVCTENVLAEAAGERSTFFVGDVKQAIYGWNGGDHRLLPEIAARYGIEPEGLNQTRRCCPSVLQAVNAVFSDVSKSGLIESAAGAWEEHWREHTAGGAAALQSGLVLHRRVPSEEDASAAGPADSEPRSAVDRRLDFVCERIREAAFLQRGLSVGLLVRSNAQATLAAEHLRANGIECLCETDLNPAEDNLVCHVLLSALRAAVHPGDRLARETVAMTPAADSLGAPSMSARLLGVFTASGAEATVRLLVAQAHAVLPRDAFSAGRVEKLLEIAREYDATGERDADGFLRFAAATTRRDKASRGLVQVMTIHKSKGLEFDCVFLPFIETKTMEAVMAEDFMAIPDDDSESIRGVIAPPVDAVLRTDPVLAARRAFERGRAAYESLCLLYVAMTRARRELVILTDAPGKSARQRAEGRELGDDAEDAASPSWAALIDAAFGNGFEPGEFVIAGERDWYGAVERPVSEEAVSAVSVKAAGFSPRSRYERTTPSEAKDADFSPEPGYESTGKEFGTEVHRLFEQLGRIAPGVSEDTIRERLMRHAPSSPSPEVFARASEAVLRALRSPEVMAAFDAPASCVVRTELAFSFLQDDGRLLSGTMDRLVLTPGEGAVVYDFKTDACAPESLVARYAGAMRCYREAAAGLFGLETSAVRLVLLHTPSGRAVEID